jgi:hypothetical protein
METKIKYTALVSFLVEIEADNRSVADYIASQAVPKHFSYNVCGTDGSGSGKFKKALNPMVMVAGGEV